MIFQYDSLNSLMSNITRVLAMFLKKRENQNACRVSRLISLTVKKKRDTMATRSPC